MLPLLKYWPNDGCIRIGWAGNAYSSLPEDSVFHRQLNYAMLWTLGNPERFYVRIGDYFGTDTGVAKSMAEVYYKQADTDFKRLLPDIPLQNPDDVIGVVEALNERFAVGDSAEAKAWRECMACFDKELQEVQAAEYSYEPAIEERDLLCDRVAEKLKTIIRTPDTRPSKAMAGNEDAVKALVEEFTLAAIYLEIMYLKKDEQDIDSYYWNLHEQNEYEERLEKESGRNLDFIFW